jgi:maltose O-acetyltransferase
MAMVRDHDGHRTAPVVIGDRVWLGHGVMVEPGVTIGDDAVISAGSVVMEDVPPRMIAMGNPARCVPLRALRRAAGARSEGAQPKNAGRLPRQVPDGWRAMPWPAGDKSGANSMRCFIKG